jgi:hypothetical protein
MAVARHRFRAVSQSFLEIGASYSLQFVKN